MARLFGSLTLTVTYGIILVFSLTVMWSVPASLIIDLVKVFFTGLGSLEIVVFLIAVSLALSSAVVLRIQRRDRQEKETV